MILLNKDNFICQYNRIKKNVASNDEKFFVGIQICIPRVCSKDQGPLFNRYFQGQRNGFHLGVAYSNADFEKVNFQTIL